jgi:hypothetical protein
MRNRDVTCYACPQCGETVSSGRDHTCGVINIPDSDAVARDILRKRAKIIINTNRARKSALVRAASLCKQTLEDYLLKSGEETAAFKQSQVNQTRPVQSLKS